MILKEKSLLVLWYYLLWEFRCIDRKTINAIKAVSMIKETAFTKKMLWKGELSGEGKSSFDRKLRNGRRAGYTACRVFAGLSDAMHLLP